MCKYLIVDAGATMIKLCFINTRPATKETIGILDNKLQITTAWRGN